MLPSLPQPPYNPRTSLPRAPMKAPSSRSKAINWKGNIACVWQVSRGSPLAAKRETTPESPPAAIVSPLGAAATDHRGVPVRRCQRSLCEPTSATRIVPPWSATAICPLFGTQAPAVTAFIGKRIRLPCSLPVSGSKARTAPLRVTIARNLSWSAKQIAATGPLGAVGIDQLRTEALLRGSQRTISFAVARFETMASIVQAELKVGAVKP